MNKQNFSENLSNDQPTKLPSAEELKAAMSDSLEDGDLVKKAREGEIDGEEMPKANKITVGSSQRHDESASKEKVIRPKAKDDDYKEKPKKIWECFC